MYSIENNIKEKETRKTNTLKIWKLKKIYIRLKITSYKKINTQYQLVLNQKQKYYEITKNAKYNEL